MSACSDIITCANCKGDVGINTISTIVNDELKYIFRKNYDKQKFGIDAYIDIVSESKKITGEALALHIIDSNSIFIKKVLDQYFFCGKDDYIESFTHSTVPVFILVHDQQNEIVYWTLFDKEELIYSNDGWILTIPHANVFDSTFKEQIYDILGGAINTRGHWIHRASFDPSDTIFYAVDKRAVEECDITPLRRFLKRLHGDKRLLQKIQGKIEISVAGYIYDPRELWEIESVKNWFKKADKKINWFFFCNTNHSTNGLKTYRACICNSRRINSMEQDGKKLVNHELDTKPLAKLLKRNFKKLNNLTGEIGMSIEKTRRIAFNVYDVMKVE